MSETPERRRVARLTVPSALGGFLLDHRLVRLLDLSAEGARIEQTGRLPEGLRCYLDLPPALGRGRLPCRSVWTRLYNSEQTLAGETYAYYRSGLAFLGMTPEQQAALADALDSLERAIDRPAGEPSR